MTQLPYKDAGSAVALRHRRVTQAVIFFIIAQLQKLRIEVHVLNQAKSRPAFSSLPKQDSSTIQSECDKKSRFQMIRA